MEYSDKAGKIDWKKKLKDFDTLFIFIIMVIISMILSKNFFTQQNINNLLRQNAGVAIVSFGMLMVILTGGIDLSVGSIIALTSVVLAMLIRDGANIFNAVVMSLLVGCIFGAFTGFFVAYRKIQPFVVSLAVMIIARGVSYIFSKGSPILIRERVIMEFGSGFFWGVPRQFFITILVFVIIAFILKFTAYGRIIMALGSNQEAVRLSGLNVRAYQLSVFTLCGFLASIAGVLAAARSAVGTPVLGEGAELDAIAITVIGGASLSGGKGTAFKTLLGVFILGMIGNIMNLINVPAYNQQVVKGFVILIAMFLQSIESIPLFTKK